MTENRWNADQYAAHARFVSDLGMPVVAWLAPVAGERILDLGCGDGALTAKLASLGVNVMGADRSESMVQAARSLGLEVVQADIHQLNLTQTFDAVFTNAVLHWSHDINAVVAGVATHLLPGSRFVGEFGGFGNVAAIATAVRASVELETHELPAFRWYNPTPDEFAAVLDRHGFDTKRIELIPRPTPLPTGMRAWLDTFARPFVVPYDSNVQDRILDHAELLLQSSLKDSGGNWIADYVRLRFHAVLRPGAQR